MPRDTVFVFARAPRLGTVKRRLAAEIGERAALRFHQRTLTRVLRALAADRRFTTVLAATPDRAGARWPARVDIVGQATATSASACSGCWRCARGAGRSLSGATSPACAPMMSRPPFACSAGPMRCSARQRMAATGWSASARAAPPAPSPVVRWSTRHALADTRRNFLTRRVAVLRTLRDVDTLADLIALGEPPR